MLATIGIVAQSGGLVPAGTLLSTYCESVEGNDASGQLRSGTWAYTGVFADGMGGTYVSTIGENQNGCWYPAGYYIAYSETPSQIFWTNSFSGATGYYTWQIAYNWTEADGMGGSTSGGTGATVGYYGSIIDLYYDEATEMNYIVAFNGNQTDPNYFEYTARPAGYLLSDQCVSGNGYDAVGTYWSGNWNYEATRADGYGGSYSAIEGSDINGCFYPAGYVYSTSTYDLTIPWSHGTETGDFVYGNVTTNSASSGSGYPQDSSFENITATNNQIVHSYEGTDGNGFPINNVLYFRLYDKTLNTAEWILSGTFLNSSCVERTETDVAGLTWTWNVEQNAFADGTGGEYIELNKNTATCGYYPSGYYFGYSLNTFNIYYPDEYGNTQTFTYGENYYYTIADGAGGEFSGTTDATYYYGMGYNFYSYFDVAGNQTVTYYWDGGNSYYIGYS